MMIVIEAEIGVEYSPAVNQNDLKMMCSSAICMYEQASCLTKVRMKLRN